MIKYDEAYIRAFVKQWKATSKSWQSYVKNHPEEVAHAWQYIVHNGNGAGPDWDEAEELMVRELVTNRTKLGRALK